MLTKQHLPVLGDTVIAVPPKGGHVPLPQVEPTKRVFPIEHKTVTPKFNAMRPTPAPMKVNESPKIDNRPLEEFFVPGSQFILEDVLSQLQIDANVLQPTELFATKMKARRLWTAYTDNQKIKALFLFQHQG